MSAWRNGLLESGKLTLNKTLGNQNEPCINEDNIFALLLLVLTPKIQLSCVKVGLTAWWSLTISVDVWYELVLLSFQVAVKMQLTSGDPLFKVWVFSSVMEMKVFLAWLFSWINDCYCWSKKRSRQFFHLGIEISTWHECIQTYSLSDGICST